jgi:hypothetical protein
MHVHDLRSGSCPSCQHNEIIEANPRQVHANVYAGQSAPLALAHEAAGPGMIIPDRPLGVLWSYTCRQCGLTQWVAAKPTEVPIGAEHGTRLITAPGFQAPYR